MKVHFYLDRKSKSGKCAVYCYVRENKETLKFNTLKAIDPQYWDKKNERAGLNLSRNNQVRRSLKNINAVLDKFESEIEKIEADIRKEDITTSFDVIADEIKKHFDKRDTGLFNIFDKFLQTKQAIYTTKHLYKFQRLQTLLQDFQSAQGGKLTFIRINQTFFENFFSFLIKKKGMLTNTANKQISFLKTFLIWCNTNGFTSNTNYKSYRGKNETNEVIYLTEKELMKLYNLTKEELQPNYAAGENGKIRNISRETLLKVRDLFCFQSFTGVRYGDIERITREDIKGPVWKLRTQKTKQLLEIPLNDFAISILAKYSEYPQPLPHISNQKMNEYLKILCKAVDIDEEIKIAKFKGIKRDEIIYKKYELISTHSARRTFISLSIMKGMQPESVMKIVGHSSYRMMQKYLKIDFSHLRSEMDRTWGSSIKLINNQ